MAGMCQKETFPYSTIPATIGLQNVGGVSHDFSLRRKAFRCHQAPELVSFYFAIVIF
jgi:hypothetical protein